MIEARHSFPRGFMWGTATSSHQVEGNNTNNDWYAWENEEGRILNGDKAGLACDWWGGRWREDLDRAVEMGQNAHRLSIEWSRIQPSPDRWDENALDHYREILRGMQSRGLFPLVTLHHFTNPLWLSEIGGWENEETPILFTAYTEKVVGALQEYVTTWCTINEPNVYTTLAYLTGDFPPGAGRGVSPIINVMTNIVKGHAATYHKIHELQPEAQVGLANAYRSLRPKRNWHPLDHFTCWVQNKLYNGFFPDAAQTGVLNFLYKKVRLPAAKGTQDFFGLNYYTREYIAFDLGNAKEAFSSGSFREDAEISPTGFIANEPDGFFDALKWAAGFGLPVIVTENGVEDHLDEMRRNYIATHIRQLWKAVNYNYPIKGYFHWSLVDNFEWERGWSQRFGLWALDIETGVRKKRPSVDFYTAICKENALSTAMVREYAPDVFSEIFPE